LPEQARGHGFHFILRARRNGKSLRGRPTILTIEFRDDAMKYLAIAVLLAIVVGAIIHYVNHDGHPLPAETSSGWMQR